MTNPAFMEGIHDAKKGKSIKDNPYREGLKYNGPADSADLWDLGLAFQLEKMSDV